jgi:hypothetical protein
VSFIFYLVKHEQVKFVIKRNNNHMCLKTQHLKFFDITNYLAPGFSYEQFLKAYECTQTKVYFPYEWVDTLEKLNSPTLPTKKAFHSILSGTNISEEQHEYCKQIWNENNMTRFCDFLIWYNNLVVEPFLEAIEKMSNFLCKCTWTNYEIFVFNVPGTFFSLLNEKDKDLYYTMKANNVGGPSIIFNRYHEKDKTFIR